MYFTRAVRSTPEKLTIDASGLKKQWLALTQNEVVQAEAALKSRGLPTAPAAADNAAEEGCEHLPPGGIGGGHVKCIEIPPGNML